IPDMAVAGASVTQRAAAASPVRFFSARMSGANETPPNSTTGSGSGRVVLNDAETQITASFYWSGLTGNATDGHIHCCAAVGVAAGVLFPMGPAAATSGSKVDMTFNINTAQ